jgi:hypothetical protein
MVYYPYAIPGAKRMVWNETQQIVACWVLLCAPLWYHYETAQGG